MSTFDVTKPENQVTEIMWNGDQDFNLLSVPDGVTINSEGIKEMEDAGTTLCQDVNEAEHLIKALQKAIDLGWFNK